MYSTSSREYVALSSSIDGPGAIVDIKGAATGGQKQVVFYTKTEYGQLLKGFIYSCLDDWRLHEVT